MRTRGTWYTIFVLICTIVIIGMQQWAPTRHAVDVLSAALDASATTKHAEHAALTSSSTIPATPTSSVVLVTRVVDGDTIVVSQNGTTTHVRLIGVDTPETVKPHTPVQCFGSEASAKAKEMLTGVFVRLETDPTQDTYDTYGRLLAYVFLPNGTLFNQYLIENGYGHEYTFKGKTYEYQMQFKAAQESARSSKRGLWAPGVCTQ
jgi:micrococcal nuclease